MRRNKNKKEPAWLKVIRIFIGLVFIFSSVVKGIDPVGTAYRVEDYLVVFGWTGILHFSLAIALLVIISEFLLGVAFLFKAVMKLAIPAIVLMMAFFTVVTYFDAVNNWVPDCGCFGDAVKLTNLQTFYKNIILVIFLLPFIFRFGIYGKRKVYLYEWLIVIIFGAGFTFFVSYNYNHLPVVDFRNWKEGRSLKSDNSGKEKVYVTYKNKSTGETKEFLAPNYPWNDSVWMSQWTFVDQRIDDSQVIKKYDLQIEDTLGNNLTKEIVENPDYQLIIVSCYLNEADDDGLKKLHDIVSYADSRGISIVLLTASESDEITKVLKEYGLNVPAFFADDIQLKAMIRSNPGLILLHDGTVVKKWHYNDFPSEGQLKEIIKTR